MMAEELKQPAGTTTDQSQPESALQKLYNTDSFAPSVWLKDWNTLPYL